MGSKVEVALGNELAKWELCDNQQDAIMRLNHALLGYLKEFDRNPISSAQLRALVVECLTRSNWSPNVLVTKSLPLGNPLATLRVNGLIDLSSCPCKKRHRILLNCMFDNRQALGTNLLKFEVGASEYQNELRDVISVGICISEGSKQRNNWDSSIATFDEYSAALMHQYSKVLHSKILLWEVFI